MPTAYAAIEPGVRDPEPLPRRRGSPSPGRSPRAGRRTRRPPAGNIAPSSAYVIAPASDSTPATAHAREHPRRPSRRAAPSRAVLRNTPVPMIVPTTSDAAAHGPSAADARPALAVTSSRRDPRVHALVEHRQRHRARAEHDRVERLEVELRAERAPRPRARSSQDLELADLVRERLAGPADVAIDLVRDVDRRSARCARA